VFVLDHRVEAGAQGRNTFNRYIRGQDIGSRHHEVPEEEIQCLTIFVVLGQVRRERDVL
jgi:hypothetical protein